MRFFRFISAASIAFLLMSQSGCRKPDPEACFTVPSENYYTDETISFTNCSKDATGYEWNFGDFSGTDEEESPTHVYEEEGIYTVTLTASSASYYNSSVNSVSKTLYITKAVHGCMNSSACNYNPAANIDDGSCSFEGTKTFWMDNPAYSFVELNINNSYAGMISTKYTSAPDCETATGVVRKVLCSGTHQYQAFKYDNFGNQTGTSSGSFTVTAGACELFKID
jgi:PKD repeat protein